MAEEVTAATQERDKARVNGQFGERPAHLPEQSVHLTPEPKVSAMQKALNQVPDKADALIARNPEAALALFMALGEKLREAKFKPLKLVTVRDDGEVYRGVRCPHCSTLVEEDSITAVEWTTYRTTADDLDADDGSITMRRSYDDPGVYEPLFFTTDCCDRPVSLGELREYR